MVTFVTIILTNFQTLIPYQAITSHHTSWNRCVCTLLVYVRYIVGYICNYSISLGRFLENGNKCYHIEENQGGGSSQIVPETMTGGWYPFWFENPESTQYYLGGLYCKN